MFRNIMVPIDDRPFTWNALECGIKWASWMQASLLVAHVFDPFFEEDENRAEALLQRARETCQQAGVPVETLLLEPSSDTRDRDEWLHTGLVEAAADKGADLVIVALRTGEDGRVRLGNTAQLLAHHAPCPVLLMAPGQYVSRERFLVPVDGSAHAEKATSVALELARSLGSELEFLAIDHARGLRVPHLSQNEAESIVAHDVERAQQAHISATPHVEHHDGVVDAIVKTAKAISAGMIVMGTHGRSGLSRLALGSVTEDLIPVSPSPVLLVRAAAE